MLFSFLSESIESVRIVTSRFGPGLESGVQVVSIVGSSNSLSRVLTVLTDVVLMRVVEGLRSTHW
jgi:hypothetical protein